MPKTPKELRDTTTRIGCMFCWHHEPENNLRQLSLHNINHHNPQLYINMDNACHLLMEAPDLGEIDTALAQQVQHTLMDCLLVQQQQQQQLTSSPFFKTEEQKHQQSSSSLPSPETQQQEHQQEAKIIISSFTFFLLISTTTYLFDEIKLYCKCVRFMKFV